MSKEKKSGLGKFLAGAAIGAGLGILFAPRKGSETRAALKAKINDLVAQIKNIDMEEVKEEFSRKVEEIKEGLADLDKEKVLEIAKEKATQLKEKAQELVDCFKHKSAIGYDYFSVKLYTGQRDLMEKVNFFISKKWIKFRNE